MKIYDCFSYWDEDLLLDLRLNILNDYVDYFYRTLNWKSFYSGLVLIGTVFPKGQRCLFILLICLSLGLSLCFQQ